MSGNPLGAGTKNLSVNVPEKFKDALQELAAASGLTLSQYIRLVLSKAAQQGVTYRLREEASPYGHTATGETGMVISDSAITAAPPAANALPALRPRRRRPQPRHK